MRYFCPPSIRDNYRWQLLHIARGDRSVEEYTREFFRLSRHVVDVMQDERRVVELFVIGLGSAYICIWTADQRLQSLIEEAIQLERRHIRHGTIPDPYESGSTRAAQGLAAYFLVRQYGCSGRGYLPAE